MKKIGIFYSFNTTNTKRVAEQIRREFGENTVQAINAEDLTEEQFQPFDCYMLGVPTWFDGELPNYWDEFVPALEDMSFEGKTFALFGLGNQKEYPENFGDAIGTLGKLFEKNGGKLIGFTETKGYEFERSTAVRDGKFKGLMIDIENQDELTNPRIKNWVTQLKKELE